MRILLYFITAFLFLNINQSLAIKVGDKLPVLNIKEGGALIINMKNKVEYQSWSTSTLLGEKRIIQYLPSRLSEGRQNLSLNDEVYKLDHPLRCRTSTIINYTDSIPGTQIFMEITIKKNKKVTPLCDIVLDRKGNGLKLWGLTKRQNVTIVIDKDSVIEFLYKGKLSQEQKDYIVKITNPPTTNKAIPTIHSSSPFK